jgi:hypothetical protein
MEPQKNKSKRLTPLGIVALFVSLSEVVAGLVIGMSDSGGLVQILLSCFVVLFPVFVSSLFFLVLWHRPENFYHPEEYTNGADVKTFTDAMRRRFDKISHYEESVESTVRTILSEVKIEDSDTIAAEVTKRIESSQFITIDTTSILGTNGRVFKVPYNEFESIGLFLLFLWHEVDVLPASSYMKRWVIRNGDNGAPFDKIGTDYARDMFMIDRDDRPLEMAGVKPGMLIKVERL